jgi:hypothetical protein
MDPYNNHYTQLHFERAGLFKAIRDKYACREVLYPGCSVHITPSLYFPHVVYVDQSVAAAQFFANEKAILEFISRNRTYQQPAYFRFLQGDYTQSLSLREGTFDLLLSLFAGGIAKSCVRYLKVGGLLLTNNHQGDAWEAAHTGDFDLGATVRFQRGMYLISEGWEGTKLPSQKLNNKHLRHVNDSLQYTETENYYVFERLREARKPPSAGKLQ